MEAVAPVETTVEVETPMEEATEMRMAEDLTVPVTAAVSVMEAVFLTRMEERRLDTPTTSQRNTPSLNTETFLDR